ncbi:MAG TPA: hypothetical protein VHB72_00995 [Candidatus Saccharimonadales bacterium]|nr:hypothetical protein [Candidatus Saccharimonadales bacterium]
MNEFERRHLDSRRHESKRLWGDYCIDLDDVEACEKSPFHKQLKALKELGFAQLIIDPMTDSWTVEPVSGWRVTAYRDLPNTEQLTEAAIGGLSLAFVVKGDEEEHEVSLCFGEYEPVQVYSVNEEIWASLDSIHQAVIEREANNLPIMNMNAVH